MVDLKEVIVANGISMLMMWYLLFCRKKNRSSIHIEDKLYDGMVVVNFFGALLETIAFVVDGNNFFGSHLINYISNSLCFAGTVTIGLLWCQYVDLHINKNYKKTLYKARFVAIPWAIEIIAIIYNLFKTGFLFTISKDNVYQRGFGSPLGYITLMIYFAYSIYLTYYSKKERIRLQFFPVQYFVGPCIIGVIVQFFFYGITTSWISVAMSLYFVQMQLYAENIYRDELSGLFNRRYLNAVLTKKENINNNLYGIMMDIDDFKDVNDNFGHGVGDRAIWKLGDILLKSLPDGGLAIRYAGDEFIVLLPNASDELVRITMVEINNNLRTFNESKQELFTLSVSMGDARYELDGDVETFLSKMDERMYEEKRKYHLQKSNKR